MLSERERRQLDDIEYDLLRDADFAAAVADLQYGAHRPHGPAAAIVVMALLWLSAIGAAAVSERYLLAAILTLLALTSLRLYTVRVRTARARTTRA
jgi:hypothetical protein